MSSEQDLSPVAERPTGAGLDPSAPTSPANSGGTTGGASVKRSRTLPSRRDASAAEAPTTPSAAAPDTPASAAPPAEEDKRRVLRKARRASAICAMDRVVDMSTWKDKEGVECNKEEDDYIEEGVKCKAPEAADSITENWEEVTGGDVAPAEQIIAPSLARKTADRRRSASVALSLPTAAKPVHRRSSSTSASEVSSICSAHALCITCVVPRYRASDSRLKKAGLQKRGCDVTLSDDAFESKSLL